MSWLRWPDLYIDFGQQLYVAWRIAEGDVLYRDLFYGYGPLASYLNGALFRLFGPGILVLALFNLLLIVVLTGCLYRLFTGIGNAESGFAAALVFLTVFALGHYHPMGNYNFVSPYVYDLTYGFILAVFCLERFRHFLETRRRSALVATGLLAGAVFLTKAEVFGALLPALALGLVLARDGAPPDSRPAPRWLPVFLCAGLAAPVLAALGFAGLMSWSEALDALTLPWRLLLNPVLLDTALYRWITGMDTPGYNLIYMVLYAAVFLLLVAVPAGITARWPRIPHRRAVLGSVALTSFTALALMNTIPWMELLRPLPLLMLGLVLWLGFRTLREKRDTAEGRRRVMMLMLSVFALLLMGKIVLKVLVYHYGFVLALPAALLVVHLGLYEWPRALRRRFGTDTVFRASFATWLGIFILVMISRSYQFYSLKTYPVGSGRDLLYDFRTEDRGRFFEQTLSVLRNAMRPGDTLWAVPEMPMLNYQLRVPSPLPEYVYHPAIWMLQEGRSVLPKLKQAAPDWVVLVNRNFSNLGYAYFGVDYAVEEWQWILKHYVPFFESGPPHFHEVLGGLLVMKRKEAGSPP